MGVRGLSSGVRKQVGGIKGDQDGGQSALSLGLLVCERQCVTVQWERSTSGSRRPPPLRTGRHHKVDKERGHVFIHIIHLRSDLLRETEWSLPNVSLYFNSFHSTSWNLMFSGSVCLLTAGLPQPGPPLRPLLRGHKLSSLPIWSHQSRILPRHPPFGILFRCPTL